MPTGPSVAGAFNTYIPSHESSGRLIVGYSRNINKFMIAKYCKYVPCENMVGFYLNMSSLEDSRVPSQAENTWADGADAPEHWEGKSEFTYLPFQTQRYSYSVPLGELTQQQATWDIAEQYLASKMAKCMAARTSRLMTVATTASNWMASPDTDLNLTTDHTGTATAFAGGYLDQGTSANPYIKIFLDNAMQLVNFDTNGEVVQTECGMVMNPNTAKAMAASSEVHEYIKESTVAEKELIDGLGPNNRFGLPGRLYGYNVLIDDSRLITTRKGIVPQAGTYAVPDQTIFFYARPGELQGVYGGPSFSTFTMFYFGAEIEAESIYEQKHKRTLIRANENNSFRLTAPSAGFYLQSATSV